jgi:hypothetical protein
MQFKGTARFPADAMDKTIARVGGYRNAFTYLDWTAYFTTLPADKVDLALEIEADRLGRSPRRRHCKPRSGEAIEIAAPPGLAMTCKGI